MDWLRPLALAAGALFLAIGLRPFSLALSGTLILVAVGASAWAFAVGVLPRFRPRDAYDLNELRRVHEEAEVRALDEEHVVREPESVLCPRCFEEYPHRLGSCPRCGG